MAGRLRDAILADTRANQPTAGAVAIGTLYFVTDENVLERSNGTAWEEVAINTDAHAAIDHTGISGVGGGGGGTFNGKTIAVTPVGANVDSPSSTFGTAGTAYACIVNVPGPMLLRKIVVNVDTGASGTVQFGLFHCGSSSSSATKVAGGSGALSSAGGVAIAAASAPVSLSAGSYILVLLLPSSNAPTLKRSQVASTLKLGKSQAAWTWDDTPDFTSGWSDSSVVPSVTLVGDLDAATQW